MTTAPPQTTDLPIGASSDAAAAKQQLVDVPPPRVALLEEHSNRAGGR